MPESKTKKEPHSTLYIGEFFMRQPSLFDLLVPEGHEVIYVRRARKRNGLGWIYPKKGQFLRFVVKKRPKT